MSHSILLIQPTNQPETRTYSDYESVNDCLEGVCRIYEEHLKRRNPNTVNILTLPKIQLQIEIFIVNFLLHSPQSLTISVNSLISLINWRIWVLWFIRSRQIRTLRTAKNGSKRKSTCSSEKPQELHKLLIIGSKLKIAKIHIWFQSCRIF